MATLRSPNQMGFVPARRPSDLECITWSSGRYNLRRRFYANSLIELFGLQFALTNRNHSIIQNISNQYERRSFTLGLVRFGTDIGSLRIWINDNRRIYFS